MLAGLERYWQFWTWNINARRTDAVERAVAETEAAARQSNAPEDRGKSDRGPVRLLSVVRALQRPRACNEAAQVGGTLGKVDNCVGRHAANLRCPFGGLRDTVLFAQQIAAKTLKSNAIALEEITIVTLLSHERMRHREHERGVGVRANRDPLRIQKFRAVRFQRTEHDKFDARLFGPAQPRFQRVRPGAA